MNSIRVRHGYLYAADLHPPHGSEPGKVRPVLVIQNDYLNESGHPSTWIIPCTTRLVGESILRVSLPKRIAGNDQDCEIMIDQSRSIDNRRLRKELGRLSPLLLKEVKEKLRLLGDF
jgi:mRNA interferase MazF